MAGRQEKKLFVTSKKDILSLVSHAVGHVSKRKVAEIEALYTLLKVCYSGLPGASGVLEIKGFFVNEKAVFSFPRPLSSET